MKAVEINSKTDKKGILKLNYQLSRSDTYVRVLILFPEENEEQEEKEWMNAISGNPEFDFLSDSEEDVYSVKDGDPFND